ncbi:cytochrome c biogenesis protein transmembrane region [Desulfarculus baarsii DSM 2075]|uniref:Cytochrome c biogenesis protein transmembrane region n=1 Tax=Desulfarculus baarsii (strain ATCC 33931 / DSM 2075 / LMG 7858 / VKM B-1802 / 2st14) TaxID=644282 RepID=E1QKB1_DESB2|nr:cytochrome c biogenesis protein CcdA [Desulfarculus baarsii]ADK86004.1 cytochrome c biogenesis protein transmembrane region [Desulfarculus baarsii DSM 2075]
MEELFLTLHGWLTAGGAAAMVGAFVWGVVSVALSPCHLASIPLIVGYVAGQEKAVRPGQGVYYSLSFTAGLFVSIALVGLICSLLGLMLGDIGPYWTIAVGAVLLLVALDMLGLRAMSMSGGLMAKLKVRGLGGALVLGLAYGVLSGSCTFGFLAPIMAVITVQQDLAAGLVLIGLFGLGHALPIAVAGSSTALVSGVLENSAFQRASLWFKRVAGVGVGLLGVYFIASPFFGA